MSTKKIQKAVTEAMGNVLENQYGWETREEFRCSNCTRLLTLGNQYCPGCGKKIDEYVEPDYLHKDLWSAFLAGLKRYEK